VFLELFTDITGELDPNAQAELRAAAGTSFYEVLAGHFERSDEASEELLALCRASWAHSFVGPIYALLLHRWVFSRPDAGGGSQRVKHVHVLTSGARDLFVGDAHGACEKFRPLFHFLFYRVAFDAAVLLALPAESQHHTLGVIAAFVPYYMPASTLRTCLTNFPAPRAPSPAATPVGPGPAPGDAGAARGPAGATFLVTQVAQALRELNGEEALLKHLRALQGVGGSPVLDAVPTMVRVRLQIELYSLTTPGAPRWAPQTVRSEALRTLDCLFPMGRGARRLVCFAFRVLHPGEVTQAWGRWAARAAAAPLVATRTTATWAASLAGWWLSGAYRAAAWGVHQASGAQLPDVSAADLGRLPLATALLHLLSRERDSGGDGGRGGAGPPGGDGGEARGPAGSRRLGSRTGSAASLQGGVRALPRRQSREDSRDE